VQHFSVEKNHSPQNDKQKNVGKKKQKTYPEAYLNTKNNKHHPDKICPVQTEKKLLKNDYKKAKGTKKGTRQKAKGKRQKADVAQLLWSAATC
jgi:uncharacterized protein (DUF927 family)